MPYMISNSASLKGGATLFFTTLTRVRLPIISVPLLSVFNPADLHPHRGIEFQRTAAGSHLRIAIHHAHLFTQLIDKNRHAVRLGNRRLSASAAPGTSAAPAGPHGYRPFLLRFPPAAPWPLPSRCTITSIAPERTSASAISKACSPVSGWDTKRESISTPSALAYTGSSACSTSINAASPPAFWA